MPVEPELRPSFNLWTEPWITLERCDGIMERCSIAQALSRAHEYRGIYDCSPLVIAGVHRLLTAIGQAIIDPHSRRDLASLLEAGCFPAGKIEAFGEHYGLRFDLFSPDAPFLQSADLSMTPMKGDALKSVSDLAMETSRTTALGHYRHGDPMDEVFCPACAACGLVIIPAFASAGGRGFKTSINGMPPIYVLPTGDTLFESLVLSLLIPSFQPRMRDQQDDQPWWKHAPQVPRSHEVLDVGYLHSLTFPARRVRLHPIPTETACTRCGSAMEWGVRTIIFEMGEWRAEGQPAWEDPFVAYRMPSGADGKEISPVRMQPGMVLWREFSTLFLQPPPSGGKKGQTTRRPASLTQMAELELTGNREMYGFRCIGMRPDKAKVLEWLDAQFTVPPAVLSDPDGRFALIINEALAAANDCASILSSVFSKHFARSMKQPRHQEVKARMIDAYWGKLAEPFRGLVMRLPYADYETARQEWVETMIGTARLSFEQAAEMVGDDAEALHRRVRSERECFAKLGKKRRDLIGQANQDANKEEKR